MIMQSERVELISTHHFDGKVLHATLQKKKIYYKESLRRCVLIGTSRAHLSERVGECWKGTLQPPLATQRPMTQPG